MFDSFAIVSSTTLSKAVGVNFSDSFDHLFLVLAHDDPQQLAYLVSQLQHPRVQVVVHIDANAPLAPFAAALRDCENVSFTLDRRPILWGGPEMVEAMLGLLRVGFLWDGVRRMTFLSGRDVAVRPVNELLEFFDATPEGEFCPGIFEIKTEENWRTRQPHLQGLLPFLNRRHQDEGVERALRKALGPKLQETLWHYGRRSMAHAAPYGKMYRGSQWMSLTKTCVREILEVIDDRPEIRTFFRYTAIPDESMIQTAVMHSTKAENVHKTALHYLRWYRDKAAEWNVATLQMEDVPAIINSGAFFARKLTSGMALELTDAVKDGWHRMRHVAAGLKG